MGANNTVVVEACKCLGGDSSCDLASQWFKLADTNRLGKASSKLGGTFIAKKKA